MYLKILSLKGIQYDGEVSSVNAKTTSGEITILNHHLPLITVLAKGRLRIKDAGGKEIIIPNSSGFLEVSKNNQASALID